MSTADTCNHFRELLSAYHDSELESADRAAVAAHLDDCQSCKDELQHIARLASDLKALPQVKLSRDIVGELEFNFDFSSDENTALSTEHAGELIDAYHDGELSPEQTIEIERHIASCADCASKFHEIEKLVANIKRVPPVLPSRDLVGELNFACQGFAEALDAYVDNELSGDEKSSFEKHLNDCTLCQSTVQQTRQLSVSLKAMPRHTLSRDIVAELDFSRSFEVPVFEGAEPAPAVEPATKSKVVKLDSRWRNIWSGLAAVAAAAAVLIFAVNQRPVNVAYIPTQHPALHQDQTTKDHSAQSEIASSGVVPVESNEPNSHFSAHSEIAPNLASSNSTPIKLNSKAISIPRKVEDLKVQIADNSAKQNSAQPELSKVEPAKFVPDPTNELASLETDAGVTDALGIATDEDGLYDIKI